MMDDTIRQFDPSKSIPEPNPALLAVTHTEPPEPEEEIIFDADKCLKTCRHGWEWHYENGCEFPGCDCKNASVE